jgi:hypothetical protein
MPSRQKVFVICEVVPTVVAASDDDPTPESVDQIGLPKVFSMYIHYS